MKTPEFNNVLRRVALSFLLLAVQACGTAQKYPNISGESPTEKGQAVLHLVANDHIGEAKGFRLLSVNGIDFSLPVGNRIRIPVGNVDIELEIEWSNEIVEQLIIKFDAEAQAIYKLAIYELPEPEKEPQSRDYRLPSVETFASDMGAALVISVLITFGIFLLPAMPVLAIISHSVYERPFPDCCFVWVEKVDGEVKSGDAPPDDSDYALAERLQSLKKELDKGDDSRELKIELARLGYTEPLKILANEGDRQASMELAHLGYTEPLKTLANEGDRKATIDLYEMTGISGPLYQLAESGDPEAKAIVEAIEARKSRKERLAMAVLTDRAESGSAEAQYKMYMRVNASDPLVWLCRAADGGHPYARYRLGLLYEQGIEGVEQNNARAQMWYVLASESGHPWGDTNADRIQRTVTTAEAQEFSRLLRLWHPGQCEMDLLGKQAN